MVLKTTALDITGISPNDSAFFFRIYSMRNAMPAYRLEMVSDFGYSYEKGTSSSTTRTTRGVRSVTTQNGDDTKDLTFTTSETVSVEAHELLEWAFRNNELVEIWEVTPTVTADGLTILDNNGTSVPAGWMPDKYWVGRVNSDNYSNNAGDDNRTHEWGISLEAMHDKSWVEPIEWVISDAETYPNASLKKYTDTDNPTNTVRDQHVGVEAEPSDDDSQYAHDLTTTPPTPGP